MPSARPPSTLGLGIPAAIAGFVSTALTLGLASLLLTSCSGDEDVFIVGNGAPQGRLADGGLPNLLATLDSDSDAADVVRRYDRISAAVQLRAERSCECELATNVGEAYESCILDLSPPEPPPIVECVRGVLADHPHVLPALRCEQESWEAHNECVEASNCLDFEAITNCVVEEVTSKLNCEELPYDAWAEVQKRCYGVTHPPAFTCDNGKSISSAQQCDIIDDCGDRSDEIGCTNDPHAGVEF